MFRAFIESRADGEFLNTEAFSAFEGLTAKGYQVVKSRYLCLPDGITKNDIPFGSVRFVRDFIRKIGIKEPEPLDYPEELRYLLGRDVSRCSLADLRTSRYTDKYMFVKPYQHKLFTGLILEPEKNAMITDDPTNWVNTPLWGMEGDTQLWISNVVEFISEWRAFIHNGKVIDVRRYSGDYWVHPHFATIDEAVYKFKSAPVAYSLDFGITKSGDTLLVEANDAFSCGSYGLDSFNYANWIEARWLEITN